MRAAAFSMILCCCLLATGLMTGCASEDGGDLDVVVPVEKTVVEVIVLEHARAADVVLDLRALLANPRQPLISTDTKSNSLLIRGKASEIERVRAIVLRLDAQES